MPRELMKVDVRGTIYNSVREASQKLGVKESSVYSSLARGAAHSLGLGTGARHSFRGGKPKEFELGGVKFPSMVAASLYLGLNRATVATIMRRKSKRGMENLMILMMKKLAEEENAAFRRINGKPAGFVSPVKNGLADDQ